MTIRVKNILVFSLAILAAAAVYIWFYPLNKGILSVTADNEEYQVITEENTIQCPQNPCTVSLKTGFHSIKIQKDGYYPESQNIEIKRGADLAIAVSFKKIPTLSLSSNIPEEKTPSKNLPQELSGQSLLAPVWDESGTMLAFADKNDGKLKIWDEKTGSKTITTLKNISSDFVLYWSPDSSYLFGTDGNDVYFINIKNTARTKNILNFKPQNTIWSSDSSYLLANDSKNILYKIDFAGKNSESIDVTLNLGNAVWKKSGDLVYYTYSSVENKTAIEIFDLASGEKKEIMIKYDFPIEKIIMDENEIAYFFNSGDKTWYELDY